MRAKCNPISNSVAMNDIPVAVIMAYYLAVAEDQRCVYMLICVHTGAKGKVKRLNDKRLIRYEAKTANLCNG